MSVRYKYKDTLLLDASDSGERLISLIRIFVYSLIGIIPFVLFFIFEDRRPEVVISVWISSTAFVCALIVFWLLKIQVKTSLLSWVTTAFDISVITFALLLIGLYGNPVVATNSLVVWQIYTIIIFATTLRLNASITAFAGVCSVIQYTGLTLYLDWQFQLSELGLHSQEYGVFNWPVQLGRIFILALLTAVAVGFVIRTRSLVTFTGTDSLTGLKNRAYFEHVLPTAIANAVKTHNPLSIAFIDFDHFKSINDDYGHAVGDKALQAIADIFVEFSSEAIEITRWGGEEFALLLQNETKEEAAFVITKINDRLKKGVQITPSLNLKLQISAGITECPLEEKDPHKLIVLADDRMLKAKKTGRNKVIYS